MCVCLCMFVCMCALACVCVFVCMGVSKVKPIVPLHNKFSSGQTFENFSNSDPTKHLIRTGTNKFSKVSSTNVLQGKVSIERTF